MPSKTSIPQIQSCRQLLDQCLLKQRQVFYRRLNKLEKQLSQNPANESALTELLQQLQASVAQVEGRRRNTPAIDYPADLPVSEKHQAIADLIEANQVVIVCGETGSGKTTQLPKICLQLGRGSRGLIGHTQPRRLAASSVSNRIAEELKVTPGELVGYKVRFNEQVSEHTRVKLMTDGILLAEIHHDLYLNQYDTIIIDEAHERSLNIDFLLGYLKRLLPKRRDLKLIITSATIDPESFSRHFDDAPIIQVSGRTYPVETIYQPLDDDEDSPGMNLYEGVAEAVRTLNSIEPGDMLVFLSGERDIRDCAEELAKLKLSNTEILPLLSRLSAREQNRIFHPAGQQRIVLATNIAETSLTVPGIKYVIDTGLARISRYSWRSKMQRLPVEKISQASANQRQGRCGRTSPGICVRLYAEDDFLLRAEYTEPEIQRTNLASVILQMQHLDLGHVDEFPFLEPPDARLIRDGYKILTELGALDRNHKVTPTGRKLARLPLDPHLGRMLVEAEQEGCLTEALVITSALAIQDPRERPLDKQQAADEAHARFVEKSSDFITLLNLWNAFHKHKQQLSGNKLRRWCKDHFIGWMRMQDWRDTHRQIRDMLREMKLGFNQQPANQAAIHRAILTGLLANIGLLQEDQQWLGARNRRYSLFPGSGVFGSKPKWIMAAEIVETSRVYARTVAKIDPHWLSQKARHLLKYEYSDIHWQEDKTRVAASEKASLYGLVISAGKRVNYGAINRVEAHEIFLRHALVRGEYPNPPAFLQHNLALMEQIKQLEAKSRRQDILQEEDSLMDFYRQHIPADIVSGPQLQPWLKQADKATLAKLKLEQSQLMRHEAEQVTDASFPDHLNFGGSQFPLEYLFDPRHERDGVILITPVAGLGIINAQRCEWLVPGLLEEKITALIRSLPKAIRRNFVPAPDFARACLEALVPDDTPLTAAITRQLKSMTGHDIPYDTWDLAKLDSHLFMHFRVLDEKGQTLQESANLNELQQAFAEQARKPAVAQAHPLEQQNVGPDILDQVMFLQPVETAQQGMRLQLWPALATTGRKVNVQLLASRREAMHQHSLGLRQLFANALVEPLRHLQKNLPGVDKLCLQYRPLGSCEQLKQALMDKILHTLFCQSPVESQAQFRELLDAGRGELFDEAQRQLHRLKQILDLYAQIHKQLKNPPLNWLDTITDIQEQLGHLLAGDFLMRTAEQWLNEYPRYLQAVLKRLERLDNNPQQDRKARLAIQTLWQEYSKRAQQYEQQGVTSEKLHYYRWLLEEYRVSLFAQSLRTRVPVSEKRLKSAWADIDDA